MPETEGGEDRAGQGGGPGGGEPPHRAHQRQDLADETENSDRAGGVAPPVYSRLELSYHFV